MTEGSRQARFAPLEGHRTYPEPEMLRRADAFATSMRRRRTVRQFSERAVPRAVIDRCVDVAASAPSGANLQPWHFVVVSDTAVKRRIRVAAEKAERAFYAERAPRAWLDALAPLGTDDDKPYLETAPCLIVVFAEPYHVEPDGRSVKHYYVPESVGIATGLLVAAVHQAGLVSLVHTPSPMGFLAEVLDRPTTERPFLMLVVGHPRDDAVVPRITRKRLTDVTTYI